MKIFRVIVGWATVMIPLAVLLAVMVEEMVEKVGFPVAMEIVGITIITASIVTCGVLIAHGKGAD